MTEIELKNFETLKKFHIGDNVTTTNKGEMLFGTVTKYQLKEPGYVWIEVEMIDIQNYEYLFRPEELEVIK